LAYVNADQRDQPQLASVIFHCFSTASVEHRLKPEAFTPAMLGGVLPRFSPHRGSSPANLAGGDCEKAVTLALLRSEIELFVNGRLQQELADLKTSILDELGVSGDLRHNKQQSAPHEPVEMGVGSSMAEEPPSDAEQAPLLGMDGSPSPNPHDDSLSELHAALHETYELSDQRHQWHMAVATVEIDLQDSLRFGFELDKGSVYGTVVALPQIARSAEWPRTLLGLCARTYFFLMINYVVELNLLYLIWKEENVMDRFSGEMNLCDFGLHLSQCPGAPGCVGPFGTEYTPARLYGWAAWSSRSFVKDSLVALFPDKVKEIAEKVDPGEYGIESQECRMLCCFVFVLAIMEDIFAITRLARLLYSVPSKADNWIGYRALSKNERDEHEASFDHTTIRVAGMPVKWKVTNVVLVLIPRTMICALTLKVGIHFLMESSGIADGIVNALALSFIVSMPGLVQTVMSSRASRNIMSKLEQFRVDKLPQSCEDMLSKHLDYQRRGDWKTMFNLLPIRFMFSIAVTGTFIIYYYLSYCTLDGDSRWVSKAMYLPAKVTYSFYEFLANACVPILFPLESAKEPYWQCPEKLECK